MQDDTKVFETLIARLDIHFSRHVVNFEEWSLKKQFMPILEKDLDATTTWQTVFWKPETNAQHNLTRTAFALEYPSPCKAPSVLRLTGVTTSESISSVDCKQRLSVYLQLQRPRSGSEALLEDSEDLENPHWANNAIIVFDNKLNTMPRRELIAGAEEWHNLIDDTHLHKSKDAHPIAVAIIGLLFDAVSQKWNDYISILHQRMVTVEEQLYNDPTNDQQANRLWSMSREILQAERLIRSHVQLLETLQYRLAFLKSGKSQQPPDWLRHNINDFNRLNVAVEENLKKPIANVIDLMYKSVSIRDARRSLDLNNSLWRLSWITFIFLPLSFLSSFFGMNVNIFQDDPSVKWYFVVAVPLMVLVLLSWLASRQLMRRNVHVWETPRQRLRSWFSSRKQLQAY